MALKWYFVNRRQNLSLLTLEPTMPTDFRVGQRIRNGGYERGQLWILHLSTSVCPVHSALCGRMDDRAGTILGIFFRLLLE